MGKAARRHRAAQRQDSKPKPVPFVRRPFEGLAGETEWVAMREIVPAAVGEVDFAPGSAPAGAPGTLTVATVLPLAWAGLHRADGALVVGLQSGGSSGDASRDVAAALIAAAGVDPGTPVPAAPRPTVDTPRLQDLLGDTPLIAQVRDGFDFWIADGAELDDEGRASLDRANEAAIPTTRMAAQPSAFWCRIGARTHIRLVLPDDEDAVTDALARLHAVGADGLGDDTRLLGAFRACGLLVPVWDLDPERGADAYEEPLAGWAGRYAEALAVTGPLDAEQRRAKAGFLSRQVTLR